MDILKFKKKSILQQLRSSYQPKLPEALKGPVVAVKGAPTQSAGNQEEIKALFPNTYGLPELTFTRDTSANATLHSNEVFNVGVILSGGQAPGGHNVISGIFDGIKGQKGMAAHSSVLAWRIPWTEEPGGLQSMGSQRVGHD